MHKKQHTLSSAILILLLMILAIPIPRADYTLFFKVFSLGMLLAGLLLILLTYQKKRVLLPRRGMVLSFLVLPLVFGLYGLFQGNDAYLVIRELYLFVLPLFALILILNCTADMKTEKVIKLTLWSSMAAAFFLMAYEMYGLLFHFTNRFQFRFEYIFRNIGFISLGYVLYLFSIKKLRNAFWPGSVVIIISLFLTLSRLQWFTILLFGLIFFGITTGKLRPSMKLIILVIFMMTPVLYVGWLLKSEAGPRDASKLWRQHEAMTVIESIETHRINPVYGNGLGYSVKPFRPIRLFQGEELSEIHRFHNLYLYLIAKMGIAGVLIFLFPLILAMKRFYRREHISSHGGRFYILIAYLFFVIFADGSITGHFTMNVNAGLELGMLLALMEKLTQA